MLKNDEDLQAWDLQSAGSWGPSHVALAKLLKSSNVKIGMEIGSAFAGNAKSILDNTDVQKLYLVDPYQHFPHYDDPINMDQERFDRLHLYVLAKMRPYGDRACVIRSLSQATAKIWGEPLDFVFIDAEHTYKAVLADILAWIPHVKTGGLITGHDYNHGNFPGVAKAVHEVFDSIGWPVRDCGEYVWAVIKQTDVDVAALQGLPVAKNGFISKLFDRKKFKRELK